MESNDTESCVRDKKRIMYSVRDVANLLNIPKASVYQLLSCGELTGIRIGHLWRVSQHDLDAFIAEHLCEVTRGNG